MSINTVYRKCSKCGNEDIQDNFPYCGSSVWRCMKCGSKWTEVSRVVNPDIRCPHCGKEFKRKD